MADCIEAISVAQGYLVVLLLGSKGDVAARAGLPVAPLLETGQEIQPGLRRLQPEIPAMPLVQGEAVLTAEVDEARCRQFLAIIAGQHRRKLGNRGKDAAKATG